MTEMLSFFWSHRACVVAPPKPLAIPQIMDVNDHKIIMLLLPNDIGPKGLNSKNKKDPSMVSGA